MKRSWQWWPWWWLPVRYALAVAGPKVLVIASIAVVLGGSTGSALSSQSGSEAIDVKEVAVSIDTFQFKPSRLEVKSGTRVTWTNQDEIKHTVTSGTPKYRDGRFNSRLDGKGATYSLTFTQAGTYPYFCDRHQHMRGEITVK